MIMFNNSMEKKIDLIDSCDKVDCVDAGGVTQTICWRDIKLEAEVIQKILEANVNKTMRNRTAKRVIRDCVSVGEKVYMIRTVSGSKFIGRWDGPYTVATISQSSVQLADTETGEIIRTAHINQLLQVRSLYCEGNDLEGNGNNNNWGVLKNE